MGDKPIENVNVDVVTAGTEITFYAKSGIDTETAKYLDMGFDFVRKVTIACDQILELLEVNDEALKSAKQIPTTGAKIDCTNTSRFIRTLKLRTSTANTHIEVTMM